MYAAAVTASVIAETTNELLPHNNGYFVEVGSSCAVLSLRHKSVRVMPQHCVAVVVNQIRVMVENAIEYMFVC